MFCSCSSQSSMESPNLEFEYGDTDSLTAELSGKTDTKLVRIVRKWSLASLITKAYVFVHQASWNIWGSPEFPILPCLSRKSISIDNMIQHKQELFVRWKTWRQNAEETSYRLENVSLIGKKKSILHLHSSGFLQLFNVGNNDNKLPRCCGRTVKSSGPNMLFQALYD